MCQRLSHAPCFFLHPLLRSPQWLLKCVIMNTFLSFLILAPLLCCSFIYGFQIEVVREACTFCILHLHKESTGYNVYVVVNFLSQVIFIFPLFQLHYLHYHTQKQKKEKLTKTLSDWICKNMTIWPGQRLQNYFEGRGSMSPFQLLVYIWDLQ